MLNRNKNVIQLKLSLLFFILITQKLQAMHLLQPNPHNSRNSNNISRGHPTPLLSTFPFSQSDIHKNTHSTNLFTISPQTNFQLTNFSQAEISIQSKIATLEQRYGPLHQLFVQNSNRLSYQHELIKGLSSNPIITSIELQDLNAKANIIQNLKQLVKKYEEGYDVELQIDQQFQAYSKQRHKETKKYSQNVKKYEEKNNLCYSSDISSYLSLVKDMKKQSKILSNSRAYQSLINQSKGNTSNPSWSIYVQIPKIVEIQIPIIVYKYVQIVKNQQQKDDIDDIIDQFSLPYQYIYTAALSQSFQHNNQQEIYDQNQIKQTSQLLNQSCVSKDFSQKQDSFLIKIEKPDIIMGVDSNVVKNIKQVQRNLEQQMPTKTFFQYNYSSVPSVSFKLPLDSYAQIQSYVSNIQEIPVNPSSSRPLTPRDNTHPTILITQKINSRSVIQRFEQKQRTLHQQNIQLSQKISELNQHIQQLQQTLSYLKQQNLCLKQQQQTQRVLFEQKNIDLQELKDLKQYVIKLQDTLQTKIIQIHKKDSQLEQNVRLIDQLSQQLQKSFNCIQQKQQMYADLQRQSQQLQQQLLQQKMREKQITQQAQLMQEALKQEMTRLQIKVNQMQEQQNQQEPLQESNSEVKSRQESQMAQQCSLILQTYKQQLQIVRQQLEECRQQLKNLVAKEQNKLEVVQTTTCTQQSLCRIPSLTYIQQFQALIEEYDKDLQQRDQEVIQLNEEKKKMYKIIQKITENNQNLSQQLRREKYNNTELSCRIKQFAKHMHDQVQHQSQLIEQLTQQLQIKIKENQQLKQFQHSDCAKSRIKQRNWGRVLVRLKKYVRQIQKQLLQMTGMNHCETHMNIIQKIRQERDYYLSLTTESSIVL